MAAEAQQGCMLDLAAQLRAAGAGDMRTLLLTINLHLIKAHTDTHTPTSRKERQQS